MVEWTPEARDYLEQHLQGLEASSPGQQHARQRIIALAEDSAPEGIVTREHLLQAIHEADQVPVPPPLPVPPLLPAQVPAPPPLPQVRVLARSPQEPGGGLPQGCFIAITLGAVAFAVLVFAGLIAAMLLPTLNARGEAARRSSCASNLKQLGLVYKMYATEHDFYPSLEAERGTFVPAREQIFPEYLRDPTFFSCPSLSFDVGTTLEEQMDDHSYVYFSHALPDEEAGLFWTEVYAEAPFEALDQDIKREERPALLRLRPLAPQMLKEIGVETSEETLPVMLEWTWGHAPYGNHVLYFDGHVDYVEDEDERFPNTVDLVEALWELDAAVDTE